ncbi:MAG: 30S ribosomal protein S2 [Pseudomonadota bacterium]|nr:30S ribosomal protein S2 [Pseudomonadota bacterium]
MAATVDLKELIENGVHFGHRTCSWNPKMAPYIYGQKKDLHIHNLLKTRPLMQKALNEMEAVAANNGKILFVSTKRVAQEIVEKAAARCEMPSVNKRWPGGMLTNFKTILRSVKKMKDLEGFVETDAFAAMKKKERLSVTRELGKLQASFNGIRNMGSLPDMLFIIDVGHEHIAVREAKKLGIPVAGIVDTNCTPENIDYVIPGNDDSQKAINLYARLAADTIDAAREKIRAKIKAAEVKMEGKTKVKVVKKSAAVKDVKKEGEENSGQATVKKATETGKTDKVKKVEKKIILVSSSKAKAESAKKPVAKAKDEAKKPVSKAKAESKSGEAKKPAGKAKKASGKSEEKS